MAVRLKEKRIVRILHKDEPRYLVVLAHDEGAKAPRAFEVHPLIEEFNRIHGTDLKVIPHDLADNALNSMNGIEPWAYTIEAGVFVVDSAIAYEIASRKLGSEVVFNSEDGHRVVLATGPYKGERRIALVAQGLACKDFKTDGRTIHLDIAPERLIMVPRFPVTCNERRLTPGEYLPDGRTGIPCGEMVEPSLDSRILWRENSSYVGLIGRMSGVAGEDWKFVGACLMPSDQVGLVSEVSQADLPKLQALIEMPTQD